MSAIASDGVERARREGTISSTDQGRGGVVTQAAAPETRLEETQTLLYPAICTPDDPPLWTLPRPRRQGHVTSPVAGSLRPM